MPAPRAGGCGVLGLPSRLLRVPAGSDEQSGSFFSLPSPSLPFVSYLLKNRGPQSEPFPGREKKIKKLKGEKCRGKKSSSTRHFKERN